jgi:chitinase
MPRPGSWTARAALTAATVVALLAGTLAIAGPAEARSARRTPWVTGYYAGWFWDTWYRPEQVDMDAMTHFVFGRVAPGGGSLGGRPGHLVPGAGTAHDPAPGGGPSVEDRLVRRAHAAGTKALLMLGGDGADGRGFMLSTASAGVRGRFVERLVDYLVRHRYDGVDVDWENCLSGESGCGESDGSPPVPAEQAHRRLLRLITAIRAEAATRHRFDRHPVIITMPGYPVKLNELEPGGKVAPWQARAARLVDQYNLMTYGVGTAWSGGGWDSWFSGPLSGASITDPVAPVDVASSIAAYHRSGVPRSRLGIGLGFFGIYYGPSITGPRQNTDHNDIFEVDDVSLAYSELVRKGYLSHGSLEWDRAAHASYRTYGSDGYVPANDPNANPAGYLSYETPRSIRAKAAWARRTGVGGAMIWTINYGYVDGRGNPLLDAVRESFLRR